MRMRSRSWKGTELTEEQKAARDLARRRERSRRAQVQGTTLEEALAKARAVLDESGLRGLRPAHDSAVGGYVDREWERGWGIGCRVSVRLELDFGARLVNPDEPREAVLFYRPKVEVGWSSTGRDVATARAAVRLYADVTDLAAEVQAVLEERPIRKAESLVPAQMTPTEEKALDAVGEATK